MMVGLVRWVEFPMRGSVLRGENHNVKFTPE